MGQSCWRRGVAAALAFAALAVARVVPAGAPSDAPFHCYLTWQRDPTTTITVNFHTVSVHALTEVRYDTQTHDGTPANYPRRAVAETHVIPGLNDLPGAQRFIHTVELTGLAPGGVYYFVAGSPDGGYTLQQSVKLPGDELDGLRFIDGGDMATDEFVPPILQAAAAHSPQFAVLGGDLAYDDGNLANWPLWDAWLDNWETYMVTPDGHSVPMILAIGNHEVVIPGWDAFHDPLGKAPFYFGLFAQSGHGFDMPRTAYFRRDFGPGATLLVLDTGHVTSIDGVQADWLEAQLAQLGEVDLRMAAYHVAMYPSVRNFDESRIVAVRDVWLPLFDAGGLDLALEHHDHSLKRTNRMRDSVSHPDGTVYLGDGCFGQTPRTGGQAFSLNDPEVLAALGLTENYLASWTNARNFWLIEIDQDVLSSAHTLSMTALDADDTVLDESTMEVEPRGDDDDSSLHCAVSMLLGSANIERLTPLRKFRDSRLLQTAPGAAVVDAYYRFSPWACAALRDRPFLLRAARASVEAVF